MKILTRPRIIVAGAVVAAGLILPMAINTPQASAASTAFCKTVFTFPTIAKVPATTTLAGYHTWAKDITPFYEKLESEAPNATSKKVLGEIVTILKYYTSSGSFAKLTAYEVANKAKWEAGTKALAAAIESCAKALG
jgi:hypothetical protein